MSDRYYETAEKAKQEHIKYGQERYDEITYRDKYINLRGGKEALNQWIFGYLQRIEDRYANASDAIEAGFQNLGYDISQISNAPYDPDINYELVAYTASMAAFDLRSCESEFGNSEDAKEFQQIADDLYNILVE